MKFLVEGTGTVQNAKRNVKQTDYLAKLPCVVDGGGVVVMTVVVTVVDLVVGTVVEYSTTSKCLFPLVQKL